MKRRIYYFSGTGNSMRAARVIAGRLGDVEIVSMRVDPNEYSAKDSDMIGFIYPVYHWTMPAPAVSFVENLEINPEAYVFAIAMPSFICGMACEKLAEILSRKGIRLNYGISCTVWQTMLSYILLFLPQGSESRRRRKNWQK